MRLEAAARLTRPKSAGNYCKLDLGNSGREAYRFLLGQVSRSSKYDNDSIGGELDVAINISHYQATL